MPLRFAQGKRVCKICADGSIQGCEDIDRGDAAGVQIKRGERVVRGFERDERIRIECMTVDLVDGEDGEREENSNYEHKLVFGQG